MGGNDTLLGTVQRTTFYLLFKKKWHIYKYIHEKNSKICNVIDLGLASRLQSLSNRCEGGSLCVFYKYIQGSCSNEFSFLLTRPHEFKWTTRLATRSHGFTVQIARVIPKEE